MTQYQTEAQFQEAFVEWLTLHRWTVHAERPARTKDGWRTAIMGRAGFFDLVALRDGVLLLAELKSEQGRMTEDQEHWAREAVRHIDGKRTWAVCLRPSDWPWIEEHLA